MSITKMGSLPLLFAVLVLGVTTVRGWARTCSLETLKGSYGMDEAGTIVGPPPLLYVLSGISSFDGNGNLSGSVTVNLGTPVAGTFTGTYTVDSDCTYSDSVEAVFPPPLGSTPLHHKGTVVGDGMSQEILVIGTDPGNASAATFRKTPVGRCSLATLKGRYGVLEQGEFVATIPLPPPLPPLFPKGPFVNTANVTFDGAGHLSGEYIAVIGDGTVRQGDFSGTYTVGSDCKYTDEFTVTGTPVPGLTLHHQGSIAGEGMLQEVHYVYTDPISVVSGTGKKQ